MLIGHPTRAAARRCADGDQNSTGADRPDRERLAVRLASFGDAA
jgi:hypothetical protein